MAINLLDKYTVSKEEQELAEGAAITADESAQLAEDHATLRQEQETLVQDITNQSDDLATAQTAVDQLQEQNEAITEVAESGEMTPAAAAGFELARRAAVAPLGLDETTQTQVVDEAGLESMVVNQGVLALEQNQQIIVALEGAIGDIISSLKNKFSGFVETIAESIRVNPKRIAEARAILKNVSEDEFKAKLASIPKDAAIRKFIDEGKFISIQEVCDKISALYHANEELAESFLETSKKKRTAATILTFFFVQFLFVPTIVYRCFTDPKTNVDGAVLTQYEKWVKTYSKLLDNLTIGTITYRVSVQDKYAVKFDRSENKKYLGSVSDSASNFNKALNIGTFNAIQQEVLKDYDRSQKLKLDDLSADVDNAEITPEARKIGQKVISALRENVKIIVHLYNDAEDLIEAYTNFALSFKKDN